MENYQNLRGGSWERLLKSLSYPTENKKHFGYRIVVKPFYTTDTVLILSNLTSLLSLNNFWLKI